MFFVCDLRIRLAGEGLTQENEIAAPTAPVLRKHRKYICAQLPFFFPLFIHSET